MQIDKVQTELKKVRQTRDLDDKLQCGFSQEKLSERASPGLGN
jgi:hypothetical protein